MGRIKQNARKSTGGTPHRTRGGGSGGSVGHAPRQRETARKSTGGFAPKFHVSRFLLSNRRDGLDNDDESTDEDNSEIDVGRNEVPSNPTSRRTSTVTSRSTTTRRSSITGPSISGGNNPLDIPLEENRQAVSQQDHVVVRTGFRSIPQPYMSPSRRSGAESPRDIGHNEAAVKSAVNAAVSALKNSCSSLSLPKNEPNSFIQPIATVGYVENVERPTETISADSTNNMITDTPEMCEPSSTSVSTAFVPPPAIPGHSRWLLATEDVSTPQNSSTTDTVIKGKKKHFTPIPFPESTSQIPDRSSSSLQNPFFNVENTPQNSSDRDIKKIKKAFRNFQSIRRLLTDSGVCSHFNGFVQLNYVEKMLIKCYNKAKKIPRSDGNPESSNPPVIVLEDSSDPVMQTSFEDDDDVNIISTVSPPALSNPSTNSEKPSDSPSSSTKLELNAISTDNYTPLSSSNSTTVRKNVARKKASMVYSPASIILKGPKSKRPSLTTSQIPSTESSSSHIDEAIDTVIRHSEVQNDYDLLAHLNEAHRSTLNRLVQMGFGSQDESNFNQLVKLVMERGGSLEACLDKLTK